MQVPYVTQWKDRNRQGTFQAISPIVAKFRKLGEKVSITEKIIHPPKIETTSTRWCYCFKITGSVRAAHLSRLPVETKYSAGSAASYCARGIQI